MKIGIDISILSLATGGSVTYTRSLVESLIKLGDTVDYRLVHMAPGGPVRSEGKDSGFDNQSGSSEEVSPASSCNAVAC